jgi:hypothetical protein
MTLPGMHHRTMITGGKRPLRLLTPLVETRSARPGKEVRS